VRSAVLIGLVLLAPCAARAGGKPPQNPAVVMVLIDTLRPDRLGFFGGSASTPHLDRFAAGSLAFENAVAQAPWTVPSVLSIFTSLPPKEHGVVNKYAILTRDVREPARLPAAARTLAQVLRDSGWATAAFTGDAGIDPESGMARGFDVFWSSAPFGGFSETFPRALDWLKERGGESFFLFVHGYDVHGQHRDPAGPDPRQEEFMALRSATIRGEKPDASGAGLWSDRYDRRAGAADGRFGEFIAALDAVEGLKDRALVVVLSDHGDELFEHGGIDHGTTLYDEALRMTLLLRAPGLAPGRVKEQVRAIDVMPTVLDWARPREARRVRRRMRGESLLPFASGRGRARDAFSETDFLLHASKRSLRTADGWKLIHDRLNNTRELYDLRADPGERRNLFESDPRASALERRLERYFSR
jgi:choline-sulfatase